MADAKARRQSNGNAPVEIDPDKIEKLAALGCTHKEMAFFFNCSEKTIDRRLAEPKEGEEPSVLFKAYTLGKCTLQQSIRRQQMKIAFGNSKAAVHMLIHMSKHQLGEHDKALLGVGKDQKGTFTFIVEG